MRIPEWAKDIGWLCVIPPMLLYTVVLGPLVGWLQSTYCVGPQWKWYGPVPVYRAPEKWHR